MCHGMNLSIIKKSHASNCSKRNINTFGAVEIISPPQDPKKLNKIKSLLMSKWHPQVFGLGLEITGWSL